jgi:hypothetical protein
MDDPSDDFTCPACTRDMARAMAVLVLAALVLIVAAPILALVRGGIQCMNLSERPWCG